MCSSNAVLYVLLTTNAVSPHPPAHLPKPRKTDPNDIKQLLQINVYIKKKSPKLTQTLLNSKQSKPLQHDSSHWTAVSVPPVRQCWALCHRAAPILTQPNGMEAEPSPALGTLRFVPSRLMALAPHHPSAGCIRPC